MNPSREEVRFYVAQALGTGSPVLQIGCGSGSILLAMGQAGLETWAIDPGPPEAWSPSIGEGGPGNLHLVAADLREFELGPRFGLVYAPQCAFMQLLSPEDQLSALACFHRHLLPRGKLLLHLQRPVASGLADLSAGEPQPVVRKPSRDSRDPAGRKVLAAESAGHLPASQRLHRAQIYDTLDRGGRICRRRYVHEILRYVHRWECEHLLHRAGFVPEQVFGDFQGGELEDQQEMIFLARRRTHSELREQIAALEREASSWSGDNRH
ncbi:MAG: class I SAM-dependent methyltransferase [Armatimonadetes bacterium]|nr:class I SAM-dependent methyltransferase [Armatimonadota bacterium]